MGAFTDTATPPADVQPDVSSVPETPEIETSVSQDGSTPETQVSTSAETETPTETPELGTETQEVETEPAPEPVQTAPKTHEAIEQEKALNEIYRQYPQVKEFLNANPQLKPFWHKAAQFNREFKTIDDAKLAKEWSTQLHEFDSLYFSQKPDDTERFLDNLWKNSLKDPSRDFDPNSNPSSGAYERVAKAIVSRAFGSIHNFIETNPQYLSRMGIVWTPEQTKIVLDEVSKLFNVGSRSGSAQTSTSAPPTGTGTRPANDPRELELQRREEALSKRERESSETAEREFTTALQSSYDNYLNREIERATKPAAAVLSKQPKGVQSYVRKEISSRVKEAIAKDDMFNRQFDSVQRGGGRNPETLAQLRTMLEQRTALYFPDIVSEVLKEIGAPIIQKQQVNDERREAAAARREPSTSASPGRLSGGPPRSPFKSTGNRDQDWRKIMGLG